MKLTITRLHLVNFKGARDVEIHFNPLITNITADNGKGKTTIPAAFNWLFTGKDQFDSAEIDKIKTWDKNKKHIEKINHSVEADLLIDNTPITLKRVLVQNWVKRRSETETVLDGHKTEYYINGVGCGTESAFKQEINKIVNERTFKLLTNPLYFNEVLEWKDRREILFAMSPPITDDEVIDQIATLQNKERIAALTNILNSGASFQRYKAELAARKKQKNEQLKLIPAKIEAVETLMPEVPDGGFGIIEHQIKKIQEEIETIDTALSDKSKANEALLSKKREKQQVVHNLKSALQNARNEAQRKRQEERHNILDAISKIDNLIKEEKRRIDSLQSDINSNTKEIEHQQKSKEFAEQQAPLLTERRKKLLEEFYKVDALQFHFNPEECKCPTCGTALQGDNLESKRAELEKNFNEEKSKKLDTIELVGKQIKADIEKYENSLKEFDDKISSIVEKNLTLAEEQATIQDKLSQLQEKRTNSGLTLTNFDAAIRPESETEQTLSIQIAEAEKAVTEDSDNQEQPDDNTELIEKKRLKQEKLDDLKSILVNKDQIAKAKKQIADYNDEESKLSQEVANIERDEDIMNEFSRTRIESIEQPINKMFQLVQFRLFDVKLNGEEKECCAAIEPNGTPAADTNTAMKINCGLDIINVLSRFYGISLPIFIDNRESVSEIITTDAQIINLTKVTGQQTLKVE